MKTIVLTKEELDLIEYALTYLIANLDDEAYCNGGKDEVTEQELIEAEKNIDALRTKIQYHKQ